MSEYLIAIDQGTTGSTVLIINVEKKLKPIVVGKSTVDFNQHYPKNGWVEHDLNEIWDSVKRAVENASSEALQRDRDFSKDKIISIGITNQRETLCVFDKNTLEPACRAIVWQCRRSTDICDDLKEKGHEALFKKKTGLMLDPYFSGTKLSWLIQNNKDIENKILSNDLCVGTIDTFLISKLTGGKSYFTEASNASRTLMYDIHTGHWDKDLLEILGIPSSISLPEIKNSSDNFGKTDGLEFLPDGISISGVLGDQQAALVGQTCFEKGEAKCTYGTGAFLLVNTGDTALSSEHGLLTTVGWQLDGKRVYALEGASFIAGAGVQFVRDQLKFLHDSKQSEKLAEHETASPELFFVPALAGLGSPHWNPKARGAFLGMTRGTSKNQLIRATLEGISFSVGELVEAMQTDLGGQFSVMRVDGGASANNLLMQFQADIIGVELDRPVNLDTTAFGAAMFAGLGCGLYSSLDEIKSSREIAKVFNSKMPLDQREVHLNGWRRAVGAVQYFSGNGEAI